MDPNTATAQHELPQMYRWPPPLTMIILHEPGDRRDDRQIRFHYAAEPGNRLSAADRHRLMSMNPRSLLVVFATFREPILPGVPRTADQELAVRALCKLGAVNIECPDFVEHGLRLMHGPSTTVGRVLELAETGR